MQVAWAIGKMGGNERYVMGLSLSQFDDLCRLLRAIDIEEKEEQAYIFTCAVHSLFSEKAYSGMMDGFKKRKKKLKLERPVKTEG